VVPVRRIITQLTRPRRGLATPMPRSVEFFFDYGSPYSYLANALLPGVAGRSGAEIVHRPMLLGGVFKATGNQSPMVEPVAAKRAYSGLMLQRSAAHHGIRFQANPHFPINTLALMRAAVAAQRDGVFDAFHAAIYPAFWVRGLDLGDPAVVAQVLSAAGLDAAKLADRATHDDVKAELRATTEEAIARGAFGAPTFFFRDQMFFGTDHLPFLERALQESPA
jgi:2-hydroxychromene-2-carboxylate isomerase